jgi:hypothetical protein
MPELEWRWGYFGLRGVMAVVALLMLLFFKRKKGLQGAKIQRRPLFYAGWIWYQIFFCDRISR